MKSINLTTVAITALLILSMFGIAGAQSGIGQIDSQEEQASNKLKTISIGDSFDGNERTPPLGRIMPYPPQLERIVFRGNGFMTDTEETKAKWIELTLLAEDKATIKKNMIEVIGKASVGLPYVNYKVKGTLVGENINLEFYEVIHTISRERPIEVPRVGGGDGSAGMTDTSEISESIAEIEEEIDNTDAKSNQKLIAKFTGTLKNYKGLKILKGSFEEISGENWEIVAFYKTRSYNVRESVIVSESSTGKPVKVEGVEISEVIPITKAGDVGTEESQIYIQPVRVYRPKILYVIPNPFAKRIVEARVIEGDEVKTIQIREQETKTIGNYRVKAGSLEEGNIEFEISEEE